MTIGFEGSGGPQTYDPAMYLSSSREIEAVYNSHRIREIEIGLGSTRRSRKLSPSCGRGEYCVEATLGVSAELGDPSATKAFIDMTDMAYS